MQKSRFLFGRVTLFVFWIIGAGYVLQVCAQDGFIDPDVDFTVNELQLQPDGRIIAAGDFNNVAGQPRGKVARLNVNGSLDASFQNPAVAGDFGNDDVFAMARQPDGKILIGGLFTTVAGQPRARLARLNADGTLDTNFAPDVNNPVVAIALQSDGKILIAGYFTVVGGQTRTNLARLNADGTLDPSFQNVNITAPGPTLPVSEIAVQTDNKVLISGSFNSIGGQPRTNAARINADGTLDGSFGLSLDGTVNEFLFTPNNKILICGFFNNVNTVPRTRVARVNLDGTLDAAFQNPNLSNGYVSAIALQTDGKVVIGGEFTSVNGNLRDDLARLNGDGTFDAGFQDPNTNFGGTFFSINAIVAQPDGKILIGGQFNMIGRQTRKNVVRLISDGTLDLPSAQNLVVTKTADSNDGVCNADCSLREAFAAANAIPDSSAITFDAQLFSTPQTITLTGGELVSNDNHRLTLTGTGVNLVTISGGGASRILRINRDSNVTISAITFANGNGAGGELNSTGGAIYVSANGVATQLKLDNVILRNNAAGTGGALRTLGSSNVMINNSTITANAAGTSPGGGGIYFDNGTLTITNSTISNNSALTQNSGNGGIGIGSSSAVFNLTDSNVSGNTAYFTGGIGAGGTTTIANTVISNNHASRSAGGLAVSGTVSLSDSTVTGNTVTDNDSLGGGIGNFGNLTIINSTVANNSAAFGGGIYTQGGLTLNGSSIASNGALFDGGGIYNNAGGSTSFIVLLQNSVVRDNTAAGFGGGLYNRDSMSLNGSTVSGNTATLGGGGAFNVFLNVGAANLTVTRSTFERNITNAAGAGLANQAGTIKLTNSTLSGNSANGVGGAINSNAGGTITLSNSTVAFNTATLGTGGGVNNTGSTVSAGNTIFANNGAVNQQSASDFNGTLNSLGYNLLGSTNGVVITGVTTGNRLNANPILSPLSANGGLTKTHALRANSPAIDAGAVLDNLTTDQRGTPRPFDVPSVPNAPGGNASDIGAFERQPGDVDTSTTPFDFDGDSKSDISIFRPSSGTWWINRSSSGQTVAAQFGNSSDRLVPGDFTGDGRADIAIFRPATGEWFVLRSEDGSFFSFPFGAGGDVPVGGDFDGDGKADPAVFRPSTNEWFISKSSGGTTIRQFGTMGDLPVAADYDGDGRADVAIYRPSSGQWWLARSTAGLIATTFGTSSDKPVPGDYTGDGRADIAFFRPNTGEWFILRSEDASFFSFPFGASGDIPAPADYDGDGRFDPAVFRPSGSTWFINRTAAGLLITNFGTGGDQPIPNVFVP